MPTGGQGALIEPCPACVPSERLQIEMLPDRVEIPVGMKQPVTVFHAE